MSTCSLPGVTVIICAYDQRRLPILLQAIGALNAQTVQPNEILLVIDHNEMLLQAVQTQILNVRCMANTFPCGAAGARNTAIVQAHSDILAFLDDDAVPENDWIEALLQPYHDPSVIGVGGPSQAVWEVPCPDWFPPEFNWVLGCSNPDSPSIQAPVRNLWGVNMSLRRTVFDHAGLFDTEMGRVGTLPLGCEETELCIRIQRKMLGTHLLYIPEAVVNHHVTAVRVKAPYFLSRCYHEGRSKAWLAARAGPGDSLAVERSYLLHHIALRSARNVAGVFCGRIPASYLTQVAASIAGVSAACLGFSVETLGGTRALRNALASRRTRSLRSL